MDREERIEKQAHRSALCFMFECFDLEAKSNLGPG